MHCLINTVIHVQLFVLPVVKTMCKYFYTQCYLQTKVQGFKVKKYMHFC